MSTIKYLVVEGDFDEQFFGALLPKLNINGVMVRKPPYGGKGNAIDFFVSNLLNLRSGGAEKLALILDADFSDTSKQGFRNTLDTVIEKSGRKGFELKVKSNDYRNGILLQDDTYKFEVALWIMPNNNEDGYFEYMLFNALDTVKKNITSEAKDIVSKIKNKEYPSNYETKAKLAIAMAMLENPGKNIRHLTDKNILDYENNKHLKTFITFLRDYFK